jgi:hypothetical protein
MQLVEGKRVGEGGGTCFAPAEHVHERGFPRTRASHERGENPRLECAAAVPQQAQHGCTVHLRGTRTYFLRICRAQRLQDQNTFFNVKIYKRLVTCKKIEE